MQLPNKTNAFVRFLKPFVPEFARVKMRKLHQRIVFKKAIRAFRDHYREIEKHPQIINNLIYGWGNMGWSSYQDYTSAIIEAAKHTRGPVLECGSGLSTIILGIIADDNGLEVWTLEHHQNWASHVKNHLADQHVNNVKVCFAPLKNYEGFEWYDVEKIVPSAAFSLVICDGPPHDTQGGRYGLLPVLYKKLADKSLILLDDYVRDEEKVIVVKWQQQHQLQVSVCGDNDMYARIIYNKR